ncbi:MAG: M48 family metalloprotease [Rhodobacteraceae bacterium]|nr:M48 family metalloprotease [Paracoccaceae bacterium]
MTRFFCAIILLLAGVNPAFAEWPAESVAMGARDHPKVLQRYSGEVQNPALTAYVARIGAQVVAVSARADEHWKFTVLDSAEVNAFALPGGYVYLTRGLLALANNESELAAVLAHEITHIIEAHVEARQAAQGDALVDGALSALVTGIFGGGENRVGDAVRQGVETAFGQIGAYSKAQEFAADAGGIELLRAAGYRPAAQADFLAAMAGNAALKAALAGREYDAANAPIFALHPAPAERQLQALALAGNMSGRRGTEDYLAAINGLIFGENHRGGFMVGRSFIHPELEFFFEVAEGLRLQNAARQINIFGPNRSTLIMSGGADTGDLGADLRAWAQQIPRRDRQNRNIANIRLLEINGLDVATGTLSLRKRGQRSTLRMTVIRFNDGLIRFAGTVRRGDEASADLQWQTVQSFSWLSEEGMSEYPQTYISVHKVAAGETVEDLVQRMMAHGFSQAQFRVLNGLASDEELQVGRLVKLVSF